MVIVQNLFVWLKWLILLIKRVLKSNKVALTFVGEVLFFNIEKLLFITLLNSIHKKTLQKLFTGFFYISIS